MISRYEAWMNGEPLSGVHSDLLILDIAYSQREFNYSTQQRGNRDGLMVTNRYTDSTSVQISFELHIYDIQERMIACQQVAAWAMKGGILKTNDKPGQRLRVVCATPPTITSARNWTDVLTVTFVAYVLPYWEQDVPSTLPLNGTSGEGELYVPGNAGDTLVSVTVIPSDETLTAISLTVGSTSISLTGISVASRLVIDYDDELRLRIRRGSTFSYLNKRTGSDDLLAVCGQLNHVEFTANARSDVTFSARGLWV